jgi:hypothetical protein
LQQEQSLVVRNRSWLAFCPLYNVCARPRGDNDEPSERNYSECVPILANDGPEACFSLSQEQTLKALQQHHNRRASGAQTGKAAMFG